MSRMLANVVFGTILGAITGCVPAAVAYVAFWGSADSQFGMWIAILVIVNASLGMVTGLAGGFMYGAKQRLPTTAAPCLGVIAGGIASVVAELTSVGPRYLIWLAPVVGLAIGIIVAILTWRKNQH